MTAPFALNSNRLVGIGDLAELAGVSHRALRFYEAEGLIQARRDRLNTRYYDGRGRERVLLVVRLRRAGLSLKAIRELLALHDGGEPIAAVARRRMTERLESLERERSDLIAALAEIDGLDAVQPMAARLRSISQ
jgi:DNA-binding transcriptional MerR regulator